MVYRFSVPGASGSLGARLKRSVDMTSGVKWGAVLLSSVWAFVFTYGMLWLIDRITKVKVDEAGEAEGLDSSIHGESAYVEAI